jgi:signal transduction histidine kinase
MTVMDRTPQGSSRRTAALVSLGAVVVVLFVVLVPIQSGLYGTALPVVFLLAAPLCGAVLLAIPYPRIGIAVFCGAAFALPLVASPDRDLIWPWPWSVPALIAFAVFVGVVTYVHGWLLGLVPLLVGSAGSLLAPVLVPDADGSAAAADLIVATAVAGVSYLVALLMVGRARLGEELTREREVSSTEQSRRMLVEERTRIARELHDVVAHSMSVIQVQASTARYRVPGLAGDAVAEFEDIAATARGSLVEMRRLLGVLRTEDQVAELAPQQGIADVPALVESLRRVGAEISLELKGGDSGVVPPAVQIASFRIVQEALSNAVRHSPDAPIAVEVCVDDSAVHLWISNRATTTADSTASIPVNDAVTARAGGPAGARPGHGLQGMRERAELLDGTLQAAPDGHGGWLVVAVLPLTDSPASLEKHP